MSGFDGGLDVIDVVDADVPCVVGIYPEERTRQQSLLVSLSFPLDTRRAAHDGALHLTVDYARAMGEVAFVLQVGAFQLIETAAEVVAAAILASHDVIDSVKVTIKKPRALGGNGMPSIAIVRHRDTNAARWTFPFGVVDVVQVLPAAAGGFGLYRLHLRKHHAVSLPADVRCLRVDGGRQGEDLGTPRKLTAGDVDGTYLLIARPGLGLDAIARA